MASTRIGFVRHGETDWNIALRMQGHRDLPLNTRGLAQAAAAGPRFFGLPVAALYSSDLLRARQTAQPIANALGLPVIPLTAMRERNFGRCEGMTLAEIAVRYPDDAAAIESHDPDYASPGAENYASPCGESRRQHEQRVLAAINGLVETHAGETIVVVTHGGVLDVIYRRALALPIDAPRDYLIPNAGINWLAIAGEQWLIDCWGDTAHLDPTNP